MNLEQVAIYIREPHALGLGQAEDLKQLCEDFPYTSVYPLLYLTALSNAKSPALEGALEKYAYRLSDRTRLFDLVSQVSMQREAAVAPNPQETTAAAAPATIHPVEEASQPEAIPEEANGETIATGNPPARELQTGQQAAEESVPVENSSSFDYFTTASSVGQDYFSLEDEEDVEVSAEEAIVEIAHAGTEEYQDEIEEPEPHQPESSIEPTGPRSFTDWLKSNGSSKVVPKTPEEESAPSKNALIDRFIEKQPTITRQKAEFFSPPKKAKESLNEDAMPVSETLAKIFTMQGNYPKAIHVYHQLMLANPEKKTFFAVQIEELKKKLTL